MNFSDPRYWSYLVGLWPLLFIFLIGQILMRLNGNAAELGITASLSIMDAAVFLLLFGGAAWWTLRPLRGRLSDSGSPDKHRHLIETYMTDFPWRALRGYLVAGWSFSAYLVIIIPLVAMLGNHPFTWRMFVALTLNFCFGAGVLGPALAVAISIVYSTRLRLKMSRRGWFTGTLGDKHTDRHITSSAHRPWLVFLVTGFLPVSILSIYIWLALGGNQAEARFILSQSLVLLVMSASASILLVFSITRTLQKVTTTLERGLKALADGHFKAHVPVLMDDDMGELARGLNTAMQGLQEREDLKDSLALAAEIQQGLLPKYDPLIPFYHLKGFQQTCYSVGGDYYDYIKADDGRVWLMIADVSGKGYPAALTMANLQAMLRGLSTLNWPIEEAANYLNEALCDTLAAGHFVTLFMGKLQPESHSLIWINAGHVPPLLLHDGEVQRLEASAPPLGLVKGIHYQVARTEIQAGDTLLAYTDGVTETSGHAAHEKYGEARLRAWLAGHADLAVAEMPEALLAELTAFGRNEQDDDLTLLCIRREQ